MPGLRHPLPSRGALGRWRRARANPFVARNLALQLGRAVLGEKGGDGYANRVHARAVRVASACLGVAKFLTKAPHT